MGIHFLIRGVGVDIEGISRFKKTLKNKRFLNKIFTDREIRYCMRFSLPEERLAARFAGKEAVLKALSFTKKKPALKDIEISNHKDGSPYVKLNSKILGRGSVCMISLAHSGGKAIAFSVIGQKG